MDPRTVILSYSLLLCVIGDIGVRSTDPTLPTELSTRIPDSESTETKYSSRYKKAPNVLRDESGEDEDVDGAPPDHVVPHSSHEDPDEPSTKPKYTKPGDWAKPPPDRDIPLDFVPTKLYAQVRGTHTVKRLPREEAIRSAETPEEILAAPRLREVVSKSKTNTVYTEEGYEDAAYDHAGHVRDADFHEGFARKLEDQQKRANRLKKKKRKKSEDEDEETVEEFGDYDDDYRDHAEESSKIERSSPNKKTEDRKDLKKMRNLLKNPEINPKQVTENGIEKLEEDLNREYEESEKNTEKEVPENLKNPGNDNDEEEYSRSSGEDDSSDLRNFGSKVSDEIAASEQASRAMLEDANAERVESRDNEIRRASPSSESPENRKSQSSTENAESANSERLPVDFLSTPDYGKLFWDYYKTDGSIWSPHEVSTPEVLTSSTAEADKSVDSESLTSVASFPLPEIKTTIAGFDTFTFSPPVTDLRSFAFSTGSADSSSSVAPLYPSPTTVYESWKRRDLYPSNEDGFRRENFNSVSNEQSSESAEESANSDNEPSLSLQNGQSATTLIGPKKLSYTVLIRSNDKTTRNPPPCKEAEEETRPEPEVTISSGKSTLPSYAETLNEFGEEAGSQLTNGFDAMQQDFTVIRPPLPVPLGQVTFADFLPDPYGTLVRPSVTQESGRQFLGQETNGERDGYNLSESSLHDYPVLNHVGHGSEVPHVRHHRGPPSAPKQRNNRYSSLTRLVPPSPVSRSKYADYFGVRRNAKPRFDRSPRVGVWPELLKFYRTIDRSIFGRRRRRSASDEKSRKGATANARLREKVNKNSVDRSRENNTIEKERNPSLFREETNRFVAASEAGLPSSYNYVPGEKSSRDETRKRRSDEDLLNESPRIADQVINAEIESRFKDDEDEEEEEEENSEENSQDEDDSSEKKSAKIEVEVPEFNFDEVIDSNKRQRTTKARPPNKVETLNQEKYPFYGNSEVSRNSALKYITNPRQVPRKTLGGTEFYDSRDRYLECADVEPDLDKVVPEGEEPDEDREQRGGQSRLRGLGDKLDCFRAKYFDEDPLDNPLFQEKQVGQPRVPEEFDPDKFASRIIGIPSGEAEARVAPRVSRKPEVQQPEVRRSGSKISHVEDRQQNDKNDGKRRNRNRNSQRERSKNNRGKNVFEDRGQRRGRPGQTTTATPELPVTPYQREVYEDVMGTIKNLAGMYQTFGESVLSLSVQPNVNQLPTSPSKKERELPVVHITERPRGFIVRGLLPPHRSSEPRQILHRYRIIPYRTNKVSYGTRPRLENPQGAETTKIGYFKTVRVHKRSLDDASLADLDAEESRIFSTRVPSPADGNANQTAPTERKVYTIRDRIRHSKPRGDFRGNGKFSNLEAAGTEDVRRREPRYNASRRRKAATSTGEPATTSYGEETDATNSEDVATVASLKRQTVTQRTPRQDFHDEPGELYKIQYSTQQRRQARPSTTRRRAQESRPSEDYNDEAAEEETDEDANDKPRNSNYDVRENVEDDVTTPPAIRNLQKFLENEPPGYSEAFGEETTEASERFAEEEEPAARNYGNSEDGQADEESGEQQVERPSESYVEEESAANSEEVEDSPDSPQHSESYKNSEDEDEDGEEENEEKTKEDSRKDEENSEIEDDEKEFMRFASRPFSPFESNEDRKYSDLGPRISKPSFYHPSFSELPSSSHRTGTSGGKKYSSGSRRDEESEEEDDRAKPTPYVFPWQEDEAEAEEGVEESKRSGQSIDRYEYPWEKRARLAKERRRKQKEREAYEKLFEFPDSRESDEDENEQDASNSDLLRTRVYPWEHYDVPSKTPRGVKSSRFGRIVDNDEMSSEHRPVAKFSSRYKSRNFDWNNDDDPIVVSGADPREIRVSVIKSVEDAAKNSEKSNLSGDKTSNTTTGVVTSVSSLDASTSSPAVSRRLRNGKSRATGSRTSTTISSVSTTRRPRIWRVASSSTTKPAKTHQRRRGSAAEVELLKSGTEKKEVRTQAASSTPASTSTRRKIRRRGQSINSTTTKTTTAKPVRRRLQKTTEAPKTVETSSSKTSPSRTTTPSSKTVEHRSRFSKEEIITKTSYPRINSDKNAETGNTSASQSKDSPEVGETGKNSTNERVEKVSIVTKETPEHIYRKEEIDKDGVKGMFVSITPNNGTNSSRPEVRAEEAEKEILRRFETSEDDEVNTEEDLGGAFMRAQDSYLLANLLRQVPPYANDLRLDEYFEGGMSPPEPEESRNPPEEEESSSAPETEEDEADETTVRNDFRLKYAKNPHSRLYYYVEKRKR